MPVAVLMSAGTAGALLRAVSASPTGRLGGSVMVAVLTGLAVGASRSAAWALGACFFVGLFTLWAAIALGLQGFLSSPWTAFGIAWALAVMVTSVRAARP